MDCVLGIDLGTSYFKLALFDVDGRIRGSARISVPKRVAGNRCELDADLFWQVLRTAVAQVCAEAGITARQIVALSYASQANSFLLLDSDNAPLTPLVLWPDRRLRTSPAPSGPYGTAPTSWKSPVWACARRNSWPPRFAGSSNTHRRLGHGPVAS